MLINGKCQSCGEPLEFEEAYQGEQIVCLKCGKVTAQLKGVPFVAHAEVSKGKKTELIFPVSGDVLVVEGPAEPSIAPSRPVGEVTPRLVKCPDCDQWISRKAPSCPHCGLPFRDNEVGPIFNTVLVATFWTFISIMICGTLVGVLAFFLAAFIGVGLHK